MQVEGPAMPHKCMFGCEIHVPRLSHRYATIQYMQIRNMKLMGCLKFKNSHIWVLSTL